MMKSRREYRAVCHDRLDRRHGKEVVGRLEVLAPGHVYIVPPGKGPKAHRIDPRTIRISK